MKLCSHRYKTYTGYDCHATSGFPKPKCTLWNAIICLAQKKVNKFLLHLK